MLSTWEVPGYALLCLPIGHAPATTLFDFASKRAISASHFGIRQTVPVVRRVRRLVAQQVLGTWHEEWVIVFMNNLKQVTFQLLLLPNRYERKIGARTQASPL